MYETHRGKSDSSEVFATIAQGGNDEVESDAEGTEMQFTDESGKIFMLRPKKATKSRNKPGNAETSKQGSVTNSQGTPNGSRPPLVCIRCGDPGHFVKDCPRPYRPVLGPRFSSNVVKQQKLCIFPTIQQIPKLKILHVCRAKNHLIQSIAANPQKNSDFGGTVGWEGGLGRQ